MFTSSTNTTMAFLVKRKRSSFTVLISVTQAVVVRTVDKMFDDFVAKELNFSRSETR